MHPVEATLRPAGGSLASDLTAFRARNGNGLVGATEASAIRDAFFARYAAELAAAARVPEVEILYAENARISMCHRDTLIALTSLASLCAGSIVEFGPYVGGTTVALCRGAAVSGARVITIEKGGSYAHSSIPSADILGDLKKNLRTFGVDGKCRIIEGQYGELGAELRAALAGSIVSICVIDADGRFDSAFQLVEEYLRPGAIIVVDDYLALSAPEKAVLTKPQVDALIANGKLSEWGLLSGVTWIGQLGAGNAAGSAPKMVTSAFAPRSDKRRITNIGRFSYAAPLPAAWSRDADNATDNRSPVLLFEDGFLLGPPHSSLDSIGEDGGGAYCHWDDELLFSSSDNSDPTENGRTYEVSHGGVLRRLTEGRPRPFSALWWDAYSGNYEQALSNAQYDAQSRQFLERKNDFAHNDGMDTSDEYVDDLIHDLTGTRNFLHRRKFGQLSDYWARITDVRARAKRRDAGGCIYVNRQGPLRKIMARRRVGGRVLLKPKFLIDYFDGKRCLDIGCGAGRWTRTLLALGAEVKSVDISERAVMSTRRFNNNVERLDLFDILDQRPDLQEAFDFTLCREIVTRSHDPLLAFKSAACTVRPGGALFLMVYAPTVHGRNDVLDARRHYHLHMNTDEERLEFINELAGTDRANAANYLALVGAQYKWTVDEATVRGWCKKCGLMPPQFLNAAERHKNVHHVLIHKP